MTKHNEMLLFLVLLVLIWGLGWPMITIGLPYCPPIWFSALRFVLATLTVFIPAMLAGMLVLPSKKDIPLILSVGLFQMGAFVMLITLGLEFVEPGRSAIIAYTSPFYVLPIAHTFFGEKLSKGKITGLILGTLGIVLLFSPWELNWSDKNILYGNGLLVLSAMVWAGSIIHVRYSKWHSSPHFLLPWQLLLGTIPNVILAFILIPDPKIEWGSSTFLLSLFYCSILATSVAYWLVITITRYLEASTTSLVLLAVPVVGLLASHFIVNEPLTLTTLTSMGLIISGLVLVTISNKNVG